MCACVGLPRGARTGGGGTAEVGVGGLGMCVCACGVDNAAAAQVTHCCCYFLGLVFDCVCVRVYG